MTARWSEALDAMLDLYLYNGSPRGTSYANGWAASYASKGGTLKRGLVDRLPERIAAVSLTADPFYVDPDMMTVWEAAVPGFTAETLEPSDLLTPTGFVWLPRPFAWVDAHGRHTSIRAFAWHESEFRATDPRTNKEYATRGVVLMSFHRIGDADDYDTGTGIPDWIDPAPAEDGHDHQAKPSRWHDLAVDGVMPYRALGLRVGDLNIDHIMPWEYGRDDRGGTADAAALLRGDAPGHLSLPDFKLHATHPQNVQRPIQAMWRLMQQTIFTRDQADAARPTRRRAERASFPERRITVVRLRRPSAPAGDQEHGKVEWTHRWLVSGHWRWQPYGDGVRRQIWISPYVKGPDDKPLEVRKIRVFELVR
jgi:hypothetical protein